MNSRKLQTALPAWAEFERCEHDNGRITYESHGYETDEDDDGLDTFIVIDGVRAKDVADKIRAALSNSVPDGGNSDVVNKEKSE